jgi:hypothetical protein
MQEKKILFFSSSGAIDSENLTSIAANCPGDWKFLGAPVIDPDAQDPNREDHWTRFVRNPEVLTKRSVGIQQALTKLSPDLVLTTLDWHPLPGQWIEEAKKLGIPNCVVVSEGFFPVESRWYSANCLFDDAEFNKLVATGCTQLSPATKAENVACWSTKQRDIFLSRGADPSSLHVTGQPRLDKFIKKNLPLKVDKAQFNQLIGNKNNKPVITYCCQALDTDSYGIERWEAQRQTIVSLLKYALDNDCFIYIRNHPIIGRNGLGDLDRSYNPIWHTIEFSIRNGLCFFDGVQPHKHLCDIYYALSFTDLLVAQSSTTLLQAILMNVQPLVVDLTTKGEVDPLKFSEKGGLDLVTYAKDLPGAIDQNISRKININNLKEKDFYLDNYLPGVLDGNNGKRVFDVLNKAMK